ncbi:hypothetical protein SAMN02745135_00675 [Caloranaerobacter azorensis DSM 13643]|uniref:Uncharacterized protein n=1 Tax=Caloranaerobacter azorensis DSM 13643 TaxID=1121264 RepID=A0A1M5SNN8_9FIRM|nr:hypothetical protein [Caloranaerobacter azorensis]SHH40157.1 hypothetical protein SAMN02745135_00675 [Caloranaerobacter azorensis DSM 13643]
MKRKLIVVFILMIIILFFGIGQAQTYNDIINEAFVIKTIRTILVNRMNIMNLCIYEGLDLNLAEKKLKEIEVDVLVKEDLKNLAYLRENPTDLEYVSALRVLNISLIDYSLERIRFKTEIEWEINYYEDKSTEVFKYEIELIRVDDRFLLNKFKSIS